MKKKLNSIKSKITCISLGYMLLLPTPALCAATNDDIYNAINSLNTSLNTNIGTSRTSIVKALNDGSSTSITSTLAQLFNNSSTGVLYNIVTNFYQWFTPSTNNLLSLNFSQKDQATTLAVGKQLSQDIGYNSQLDIAKKSLDILRLLAMPIENDPNNISITDLLVGPNNSPATSANSGNTATDLSSIVALATSTPYGSIDDNAPTANNAPTINDLMGVNSYSSKDGQNKAKLFISYLLKSTPAPTTFYIPKISEANNGKVTIYTPQPNQDGGYITTQVSTNADSTGAIEYYDMLNYLNGNSKYYQPYKLKSRSAIILRSVFIENLFRIYQERVKDLTKPNDQSLVEQEKAAALEGLNGAYYADLKNKSVAEVNLEMLHAINKQTYFLYKLHQDNERSTLMLGITGLLMAAQAAYSDKQLYIKPISNIITNKCWQAGQKSLTSCQNPATSDSMPSQPQ